MSTDRSNSTNWNACWSLGKVRNKHRRALFMTHWLLFEALRLLCLIDGWACFKPTPQHWAENALHNLCNTRFIILSTPFGRMHVHFDDDEATNEQKKIVQQTKMLLKMWCWHLMWTLFFSVRMRIHAYLQCEHECVAGIKRHLQYSTYLHRNSCSHFKPDNLLWKWWFLVLCFFCISATK